MDKVETWVLLTGLCGALLCVWQGGHWVEDLNKVIVPWKCVSLDGACHFPAGAVVPCLLFCPGLGLWHRSVVCLLAEGGAPCGTDLLDWTCVWPALESVVWPSTSGIEQTHLIWGLCSASPSWMWGAFPPMVIVTHCCGLSHQRCVCASSRWLSLL